MQHSTAATLYHRNVVCFGYIIVNTGHKGIIIIIIVSLPSPAPSSRPFSLVTSVALSLSLSLSPSSTCYQAVLLQSDNSITSKYRYNTISIRLVPDSSLRC
jgi:hypothetical protein